MPLQYRRQCKRFRERAHCKCKKIVEIVANRPTIDHFVWGMKRRETFEEKEDKLPV